MPVHATCSLTGYQGDAPARPHAGVTTTTSARLSAKGPTAATAAVPATVPSGSDSAASPTDEAEQQTDSRLGSLPSESSAAVPSVDRSRAIDAAPAARTGRSARPANSEWTSVTASSAAASRTSRRSCSTLALHRAQRPYPPGGNAAPANPRQAATARRPGAAAAPRQPVADFGQCSLTPSVSDAMMSRTSSRIAHGPLAARKFEGGRQRPRPGHLRLYGPSCCPASSSAASRS